MALRWTWATETADWGVTLDEATGTLSWWGADKPRPGVPEYAQGGGGIDQPIDELLATGRPRYGCPEAILAEVIAAARSVSGTSPGPEPDAGAATASDAGAAATRERAG